MNSNVDGNKLVFTEKDSDFYFTFVIPHALLKNVKCTACGFRNVMEGGKYCSACEAMNAPLPRLSGEEAPRARPIGVSNVAGPSMRVQGVRGADDAIRLVPIGSGNRSPGRLPPRYPRSIPSSFRNRSPSSDDSHSVQEGYDSSSNSSPVRNPRPLPPGLRGRSPPRGGGSPSRRSPSRSSDYSDYSD